MQSQNAALKERVAQLEMQNVCLQGVTSGGTISLSILNSQIRDLTSPSTLVSHGLMVVQPFSALFVLLATVAAVKDWERGLAWPI